MQILHLTAGSTLLPFVGKGNWKKNEDVRVCACVCVCTRACRWGTNVSEFRHVEFEVCVQLGYCSKT